MQKIFYFFNQQQLMKQRMGCTGLGPGPEKPGLKAEEKQRKKPGRDFYLVKNLEYPDQKPEIRNLKSTGKPEILNETTEHGATLTGRNWNYL